MAPPVLSYFNFPLNGKAHKILAIAAICGVHIEKRHVTIGVEHVTEEWKNNCSPVGGTPVLQTDEGYIFESNAIVRFIARQDKSNSHVYGRTPFETAQVDAWLDYSATELEVTASPFLRAVFFGTETTKEHQECLECALSGLERWLETRTFLVGERMTAADIVTAFVLQFLLPFHPDAETLAKKFKNVYRLYNTVMNHPKVLDVLKSEGSSFGCRKVEKKKEEPKPKEKKEEKPKEQKPADDDEEDEVHEEKKKPNPLDALPPSSFVLDAFKREYSNTDTRTVAAPWFFNHFDKEGFSAFWCRYKYNEDNKMQFMTANLIRGWFQRMEGTRKYAFGVALIIGEEKRHEIVGFWIFRGKGMPQCVSEVEDTELFDWTEIPDIHAEREKITDYLCWEGPTIPLPVLEGKTFK